MGGGRAEGTFLLSQVMDERWDATKGNLGSLLEGYEHVVELSELVHDRSSGERLGDDLGDVLDVDDLDTLLHRCGHLQSTMGQ
jgi:hypothetical protein